MRAGLLVGDFWMRWACTGEPDNAAFGVWAVPDAAGAGDLVLPLLECASADLPVGELTPESMLAGRILRPGRPLGQHGPGFPRVGLRYLAEVLPSFRGFRGGEPRLPATGPRWRCHAVPTFAWQPQSPSGAGTAPKSSSMGPLSCSASAGSA
jgi:hypothetical protein